MSLKSPTGTEPNMSQSSSVNDMSGIEAMSPEELEIARAEWSAELNLIEDEIQTLRQVLTAKTRRAHELKRKLGVTVWSEFSQDMNQGIKNVRESTAGKKVKEFQNAVTSAPLYQKTESAVKAAGEKTTTLLGGIGSAIGQKLGALKNTESFRSMEERVSGVVGGVKVGQDGKIGGSRSGSVQSFDEALREATANQGTNPDGTPRANGDGTGNSMPDQQQQPPLS